MQSSLELFGSCRYDQADRRSLSVSTDLADDVHRHLGQFLAGAPFLERRLVLDLQSLGFKFLGERCSEGSRSFIGDVHEAPRYGWV